MNEIEMINSTSYSKEEIEIKKQEALSAILQNKNVVSALKKLSTK